jgi:iron complex transport system substrate-binding protein
VDRGHEGPRKEWFTKCPVWSQLDAVRKGRILTIDDDLIARAGPRLFDGLERLAELLHPNPDRGKE